MKNKEYIFIFLLFLFITICFFYKTAFFGLIPFPGDLLVSNYAPWSTASYLGFIPATIPNKGQYFDVIRQMYPWKTFVIETIQHGQLPLWNPYNFSGTPLLANLQSAVFYPLSLFYFLFGQKTGWIITVMLQPLLASFFTYLFARKIGLSTIAGVFAAVAFGFSLFTSVFLEYNTLLHVVLWLPLSLYLIEGLLTSRKLFPLFLFSLSIVCAYLGGHIQIAVLQTIFILAYGLFRIISQKQKKERKITACLSFVALVVIAIGIASMQLFPALELLQLSARVPQQYDFLIRELLLQPEQMFRIFSPDIFGNPANRNYLLQDPYPGKAIYLGLIPLFFSFFAIVFLRTKSNIRFFTIASCIILLLILRTPLTELFYKLQVPFFSTSSPGNIIFLLSFCLSVLSGFGLDYWLSKKDKKEWAAPIVFAIAFSLCFFVVTLTQTQYNIRSFIYSLLLFTFFVCVYYAGLFFAKKKPLLVLLLIGITVCDLFYFFHKFNPFVQKELLFPDHAVLRFLRGKEYVRFWGYGSGRIEANFATQYGIFSPDGYDPLYPKRYGELIQASENGRLASVFTNKTRSDAIVQPGYGEEDLPSNTARLRLLDLLGARYILSNDTDPHSDKTFPSDRFKEIHSDGAWRIYENTKALPRALLFADYKVFKDASEFEQTFFSREFDPAKTLLLEEVPIDFRVSSLQNGQANITHYQSNKVTIETKSNSKALLFLSDTHYPGWEATVDNEEAPIYRADYAFRAVVVPEGVHSVIFSYNPSSFSFGLKTSILCIVLLFVLGLVAIKKKVFYET